MSASYSTRDRCIQAISEGYQDALKEIVSSPVTHRHSRIREFKGGSLYGLTHAIITPSLAIHSFTTVVEYTAADKVGTVHHEPLRCYTGAVVPSPAPSSIYAKEIRGFLSKDVHWLPFHRDMKPAEVQAQRKGWSPLVDTLNRDGALKALIRAMPDSKTVKGIDQDLKAGPFARFEVKINDEEDNHNTKCQVVPMGARTLVATQHVATGPQEIVYPVKAILSVAEAINNQEGVEPTEGPVIQDWAERLLEIIARAEVYATPTRAPKQTRATALAPAQQPAHAQPAPRAEAPAAKATKRCPRCGSPNGPDNVYCGMCGKPLAAGPESTPTAAAGRIKRDDLQGAGRMARWLVQIEGEDGAARDVYVWSLWDELWITPQATLGRLLESIQANSHYRWVKAVRGVQAPSGQGGQGGYMHLDVAFNMQAPPPFTAKRVQLLAAKLVKGGGFRVLGSSEQGLTREQYDFLLEAVIVKPEAVDGLTLYAPRGA